MKKQFVIVAILGTTLLGACSNNLENQTQDVKLEEVQSSADMESSAAAEAKSISVAPVETIRDKDRKMLRTASLNLKVPKVNEVSKSITTLVKSNGGFITNSNLNRNILSQKSVTVSRDSALETTQYEVTSNITLRVPDQLLDTTLHQIQSLARQINSSSISSEDVTLQMLANQIALRNISRQNNRLNSKLDNTSLRNSSDNEELLTYNNENRTRSYIENLAFNDQVRYSTVNVHLFQHAAFEQTMVINPNIMDYYKTPFYIRAADSLQTGWELLKDLLVVLATIWPFLLLGAGAWFLLKKRPVIRVSPAAKI